jgi:hypothetical protein
VIELLHHLAELLAVLGPFVFVIGFLDWGDKSSSTSYTSNYRYTTDSYNSTSNVAHNISGSGNVYNVYKIGSDDRGGSLADEFAVPLANELPELGKTSPKKKGNTWLWVAGAAAVVVVLFIVKKGGR